MEWGKGEQKNDDPRTRTEQGALPRCECGLERQEGWTLTVADGRAVWRQELCGPHANHESQRHRRHPKDILEVSGPGEEQHNDRRARTEQSALP
jgi:hypothetical protein